MDRESQEVNHLFTYGTLMVEEIFLTVTGQKFSSSSAYIMGYQRYQVRNKNYPGIVLDNGMVSGQLYFYLPPEIIKLIDAYEGDEYQRIKVEAFANPTGVFTAWCYLYKTEENLFKQPWSLEWYGQQINSQ